MGQSILQGNGSVKIDSKLHFLTDTFSGSGTKEFELTKGTKTVAIKSLIATWTVEIYGVLNNGNTKPLGTNGNYDVSDCVKVRITHNGGTGGGAYIAIAIAENCSI